MTISAEDVIKSLADATGIEFSIVPVDKLNIDPSYQRSDFLNRSVVAKIGTSFSELLFNTIVVARRADGSLWVVDGQHRLSGAKRFGKAAVSCMIFSSGGPQQEAAVFYELNKTRTSINAISMYKACLRQGEAATCDIQKSLEQHGFSVGKHGVKAFAAATAVREVYKWGVLDRMLNIINEAFGDGSSARWRAMFSQSHFIQMLGLILKERGDQIDDKRMILVLARMPEASYTRLVASCAGATGGRAKRIAPIFIDDFYNRNLSPKSKVVW